MCHFNGFKCFVITKLIMKIIFGYYKIFLSLYKLESFITHFSHKIEIKSSLFNLLYVLFSFSVLLKLSQLLDFCWVLVCLSFGFASSINNLDVPSICQKQKYRAYFLLVFVITQTSSRWQFENFIILLSLIFTFKSFNTL